MRELSCLNLSFECSSGRVKAIVCPPGSDITAAEGVRVEKFQSIVPGSLASSYEDDWSNAYFLYVATEGGGLYLEGGLDAFDDPDCGSSVVPQIVSAMRRVGLNVPPLLEIVLGRRVFRSAFPSY